jgi:2'-5' RNA ligase
LEFLGDVPEVRLPDVLDAGAAASVSAVACDLVFDRVEHWKRPQVLCLSASSIPGSLASLVQSLRSELAVRGFAPEGRPYKAHVTLARKVRKAPPPELVDPLSWLVGELALVQSVTERSGSRYESLATWPLRG